ncbi:hypothetical protein CONPUDRAFT_151643 [Coniophora puteana RWD-64-598 SS2]|uniref:Uncharacterized protein n=1 Tax=Coniophora puteana (strain RWD-64-598) TaxID=741705 RepID=A0A5M3MV20_CONPW|nr:uncharacterized protein CONPUDRAFT_151643 [Coniophora puteana RWD-64-598 SS2]EIW82565.1 hypothetical protein CONPUDRAFT_151643 [Coniophora puteana RWD-64-598 SS2]
MDNIMDNIRLCGSRLDRCRELLYELSVTHGTIAAQRTPMFRDRLINANANQRRLEAKPPRDAVLTTGHLKLTTKLLEEIEHEHRKARAENLGLNRSQ